jgi:predicted ester cyclase
VTGVAELVHRYYEQAWNLWDDSIVDELLAPDFVFRGSLGDSVLGRAGWRDYRDRFRAGVPDFHNEIVDLVADGNRAAARLRYTGHQHGPLLGGPGRGRPIEYAGMGMFTSVGGLLTEGWVLGDLDGLRGQLG